MEVELFTESLESLQSLIGDYDRLDTSFQHAPMTEIPRLKVL